MKHISNFSSVFVPLFVGSLTTYYFKMYFTAVISSCLATLVLIGICRVTSKDSKYDPLIFCGTFISMGGIGNELVLLFACVIATFAFIFLKNKFQGFGGKLGTVAFIGCLASLIMGLF